MLFATKSQRHKENNSFKKKKDRPKGGFLTIKKFES